MSRLRKKWTRFDVINANLLRFAREYHGEKFRFLTLTSQTENEKSLRERKRELFRLLRVQIPGLEYRCTRTDEGNGVCHLCLISPVYIHWRLITKYWGAHIWISQEKSLEKLLHEMSLQSDHAQYSMSRGFLPHGARAAITTISRYFRGTLGKKAVLMLARRWKRPNALQLTLACCSRKDGWCSDLRSRIEYCGGRSPG